MRLTYIIILGILLATQADAQTTAASVLLKFTHTTTGTAWTSCQQAMSADNTTYQLRADLTCTDWAATPTGDNITIDLNGYTLTASSHQSLFTANDQLTRDLTQSAPPSPAVPQTYDTVLVDGKGNGVAQGSLFPIVSIQKIGNLSGASDYTPDVDFVSTTYLSGHGNYIFPGDRINWYLANPTGANACTGPYGNQPACSATYFVAYTYSEPSAAVWFSASDNSVKGATSVPLSGSNLKTLTVKNGTIIVLGAAPYSSGIHLVSGGTAQVTFDTLQIFTNAIAGTCIYAPLFNVVYHNISCNNSGAQTYIRDHFDLSGISSSNNSAATLTYAITGVVTKGSAQAGIFNQVPSIDIHDNITSSGLSYYSNDFDIQNFGNNVNIYNNQVNCSAASGQGCRGIGVTTPTGIPATNINIYDNRVISHELPNNLEYGPSFGVPGCQAHGTYGIQYDTVGSGAVYNNKVTAQAKECDAHGLRVTSSASDATTTSYNNTVTASRIGDVPTKAYALSFDDCEGGVFGAGDTYTGDSAALFVDVDAAKNCTVKGATFAKGSNPDATFHTITITQLSGGGLGPFCTPTCNIFLQDISYANGAAANDVSMNPTTPFGQPFSAIETWSYTPTFTANNTALSGASVLVTDTLGNSNTYTTDASGHLTGGSTMSSSVLAPFNAASGGVVALPQIRYFNVASGNTPSSEVSNPFAIAVSKSGCTTLNYSLTITAATTESRAVSCP